jgi:antirestriction protein ArdC
LRSDKTLIVQAAAQAQKAADFILGKCNEEAQAGEAETAVSPPPLEVAA